MVALQIVTWPELQRKRKQSVCAKEEIGWKKWIDKTRQSATPSKVTHDRAWKRNPLQCHTYTQRCNATTMEWTMQTNDFEQRNISLTWCEMGGDVEWNGMDGWTWNEWNVEWKRAKETKLTKEIVIVRIVVSVSVIATLTVTAVSYSFSQISSSSSQVSSSSSLSIPFYQCFFLLLCTQTMISSLTSLLD